MNLFRGFAGCLWQVQPLAHADPREGIDPQPSAR